MQVVIFRDYWHSVATKTCTNTMSLKLSKLNTELKFLCLRHNLDLILFFSHVKYSIAKY